MSDKELIRHAAVKSVDGWIFFGKCHGDCFHKAHYIKIKLCTKADSQGFVTSKGRFVNRMEGAAIAFKSGQISKDTNILFSEDLWCLEIYDGKYDYSETEGYIERKKDEE